MSAFGALLFVPLIAAVVGDRCIILIGGWGTGDAIQYYHPDEGIECDGSVGRVANESLHQTDFTSGCYVAATNQIVVREALWSQKPPLLYSLERGSAQKLPTPFTTSNGTPIFIDDSTTAAVGKTRCLSCGGGYKDASGIKHIKECYQFNPSIDATKWISIAPLPRPLFYGASVAMDGFYVIGGYDGSELDQLFKYDLLTDAWSIGPPMPIGGRRFHSAAALSATELIVCGGWRQRSDCEIYSSVDDSWRTAGSLISGRHNFALVNFDGHVLALGGMGLGAWLQTVEEYNPVGDSWSVVKPMQDSRRGFVAVVV